MCQLKMCNTFLYAPIKCDPFHEIYDFSCSAQYSDWKFFYTNEEAIIKLQA